jgi:hypothetical protein
VALVLRIAVWVPLDAVDMPVDPRALEEEAEICVRKSFGLTVQNTLDPRSPPLSGPQFLHLQGGEEGRDRGTVKCVASERMLGEAAL